VVVISILGLVAACLENIIMLTIYIVFLIIIFCGEICGGVIAIAFKDKIVYNLKEILSNSLDEQLKKSNSEHYYNQKNNSANCYTSDKGYFWDWGQFTFKCCGVYSPDDYKNRMVANVYTFLNMCPGLNPALFTYTPISCYPLNTTEFGDIHRSPDNQYDSQKYVGKGSTPYQTGCYDAVAAWIERYAPVLIGIGIGFAMLELFGIIFAVCLCRNTGDD
jgi:hypothetical protein